MTDIDLLKEFLEFPVWSSKPVFDKFKSIDNHIFRESGENDKQRFLFINGRKENKAVLIAHADTYCDKSKIAYNQKHFVKDEDGYFVALNEAGEKTLLGADDRAGCAILWALKDSGHSILVTDGEETGLIGSGWLIKNNPDIAELLNRHQFMIQFDRRNSTDYKCYYVGTDEFRKYIEQNTNYIEPDRSSRTDICKLCTDICGVNFSVGYYEEHTVKEKIDYNQWLHTLNMARKLLSQDLPRFKLKKT